MGWLSGLVVVLIVSLAGYLIFFRGEDVSGLDLPGGGGVDFEDKPSRANLELVDVGAAREEDGSATLDIKVRNTGEQVAFIKSAEFEIVEMRFPTSGTVSPSAEYQVEFPSPDQLPYTFTVALSQSVDPMGATAVDRFTIRAGIPEGSRARSYTLSLRLLYNEDKETPKSAEFDIFLGR